MGSVLALSLALTGFTVAFTGATLATTHVAASATSGVPFDCADPRFFAQAGDSNSTTLYEGSYDAQGKSVWTALPNGTVAAASNNLYNAVAFNPVDSFLYGTTFGTSTVRGKFVRIDQDGAVTNVGTSSPSLNAIAPSTLWDAGEFDAVGNYYVASGNAGAGSTIYKISGLEAAPESTPTMTAIPLVGTVPRYADLTFKAGYLWTANYGLSSTIYRIDINGISSAAGTVTAFTVPSSVLPTASYGSVFSMTNGNLAFIASNANMYQVSVADPETSSPTFEQVSNVAAPTNAYSDATNCGTAAVAGLTATKTGPATVLPGDPITWQITVKNNGPGTSSGFVLTDLLPTGLSGIAAVSADSGCTVNGTVTVVCNGGRLLKDETAQVTVTATAPMTLGSIVNRVKVVGNEDDDPDGIFSAAPTTVGVTTSADDPLEVTPPDGATATAPSSIEGGTVVLDSGNLVYTPPLGFSGQDSFTYTNASGVPATMYVTVRPVAGPYAVSTTAGTAVAVTAAQLLAEGTGTGRVVSAVSTPINGTVSLVSGDPVFVPASGFSGTASYLYEVTDSTGQTVTATVTVTVAPVAADETATTASGTPVTVPGSDLIAAGEGSGLTVTAVGDPVNGTVSLVSGNPVFVPAAGFSGTASFDYWMTDAAAQTATATVTVTVTPVAPDDAATTDAEQPVTIDVLANDTGGGLIVTATTAPSRGGTATVVSNRIHYLPPSGFSGIDTFRYTATDAGGNVMDALVTVNVVPVIAATTAAGKAKATSGKPAVFDPAAAATGTNLTLLAVGNPNHGITVLNPDGTLTYTPTAGYSGLDHFAYTLTDASGQTVAGTLIVTVQLATLALSFTGVAPLPFVFSGLILVGGGATLHLLRRPRRLGARHAAR